jgi:hypothetical protein
MLSVRLEVIDRYCSSGAIRHSSSVLLIAVNRTGLEVAQLR